ncbi:putative outer membrane spanin subuint [Phage vB_KsaM-C1]|nr:putative outer membrane spanin subuint [Phage vB_KsaM-C1]
MSRFTETALKTLLLLSVCVTAACSTSTIQQCPPPSNDLNTPSAKLSTIGGNPDIAADVMRDNGKVLMYDRDRVSRWQQWWKGCQKLH